SMSYRDSTVDRWCERRDLSDSCSREPLLMPTRVVEEGPRPLLRGDCEKCPLNGDRLVRGYGVGGGICIVGEAPGATEVSRDQPFVGESGRLVRMTLKSLGVDPEEAYWTNAVVCRPSANRTPNSIAISSCSSRLH